MFNIQNNEHKQKEERRRKTKESYPIAKKNWVNIRLSFSFFLSLYINMYNLLYLKWRFLCKSFSYCFGFSVLLQNAEAGARRCFKYFAKFTEKHLCRCFFLNKDPVWMPVILLKILQHRCSSENFSKFSGRPIFWNICEQLLLKMEASSVITT